MKTEKMSKKRRFDDEEFMGRDRSRSVKAKRASQERRESSFSTEQHVNHQAAKVRRKAAAANQRDYRDYM